MHALVFFSIFRNLSCSKRGRVIFEVALYENSMKIFSHYIRGRVVIEVVLFWGLYGIHTLFPTLKGSMYSKKL